MTPPGAASRIDLNRRRIEESDHLRLVKELCKELEKEQISYCHWKSNASLDRSASGDNDLDLLVSQNDVQRFISILYRLGFKLAQGVPSEQIPGILDFYNYDVTSDKWVHVHVHFKLVVGHDATKNYHLPLEKEYLSSAVRRGLFKVPCPEFEWIIFVIRMILKHSTWDTILGRQGSLSPSERHEMHYLSERVCQEKVDAILKRDFPSLDRALFDACVRSLQPGCPMWNRIKAGGSLERRLNAYARRSQGLDLWIKLRHRLVMGIRRRMTDQLAKKRLASGGIVIAVVGGDGAGKTTALDGLYRWLSKEFETKTVHMGKPAWSLVTIVIRGFLKMGRSLGLYPFMRAEIIYTHNKDSLVFPGYPWLFREICTARDRFLTYKEARRFSANAGIVICDRYPLSQVELMDGPQIARMTHGKLSSVVDYLGNRERHYYQKIGQPDLLIVLRADPETAAKRKTDEHPTSVRARSSEIWQVRWEETDAHVIDAGQTKEEVLDEMKGLVWVHL